MIKSNIALHIAQVLVGVEQDDFVAAHSLTFAITCNAFPYRGAAHLLIAPIVARSAYRHATLDARPEERAAIDYADGCRAHDENLTRSSPEAPS